MDRFVIYEDNGKPLLPPMEERLRWRDEMWSHIPEIVRKDMRRQRYEKKLKEVFEGPFIEDVADVFYGYKVLRVRTSFSHNNVRTAVWFSSSSFDTEWGAEGLVAECPELPIHPPHHVPHPKCTCGVYAWKSLHQAPSILLSDTTPSYIVKVALGGYVIPHSAGYKASIAKIVTIYIGEPLMDSPLLKALAKKYNAKLEVIDYKYREKAQWE